MHKTFNHAPNFTIFYLQVTLMVILLSACASLNPTAAPTLTESPEQTETAVPTPELIAVEEITNPPTHAATTTIELDPIETSILLPTPEATPVETPDTALEDLLNSTAEFGEAEILIKRPGQLSRITSPFQVIAYVEPGQNRQVQLNLLGEDGRLLATKKVRTLLFLGLENGNMITELSFEIEALSELGRLEVIVTDEFGRVRALNSIDLILLSMGESDRNYTPETQERVVIQYPLANYMVQGSSLLVSGLIRTSSQQALSLSLIDEFGNLLGQGSATVVLSEGQEFGLFIGEIPFTVDSPVWVRLTVSIPGKRIPGVEFIKTMEMVISP